MECWFTTSDGNTLHNNPKAPNFVPGEPPKNPNISKIDYRIECIQKGIARYGGRTLVICDQTLLARAD
jgi:hypothetical protein